MPVQNTDLMVIQQGTTAYKVSAQALKAFFQTGVTLNPATASVLGGIKVGTNLAVTVDGTLSANITGALVYKGALASTANAPAPATQGDVYVFSSSGNLTGTGWGALTGAAVVTRDMVLYDGAKWDIVGLAGGGGVVAAVTGTAPVVVTSTDPTRPDISVANAVASTSGAGGSAGLITAVDLEKLAGIASGAQPGTVTNVSGTAPIQVATGTSTPVISVQDASTTAKGVVQLADAAAVTAGTAGRVVTADQLKATNDAIATATGGGITGLTGTAPITVTPATGATRTIAVSDALTTAKGVVQLATNAETAYGVATPSATKAVTPSGLHEHYMPKDISKLTLLP
jgi:hypothetical protein